MTQPCLEPFNIFHCLMSKIPLVWPTKTLVIWPPTASSLTASLRDILGFNDTKLFVVLQSHWAPMPSHMLFLLPQALFPRWSAWQTLTPP